jgi:hypothetical protein
MLKLLANFVKELVTAFWPFSIKDRKKNLTKSWETVNISLNRSLCNLAFTNLSIERYLASRD